MKRQITWMNLYNLFHIAAALGYLFMNVFLLQPLEKFSLSSRSQALLQRCGEVLNGHLQSHRMNSRLFHLFQVVQTLRHYENCGERMGKCKTRKVACFFPFELGQHVSTSECLLIVSKETEKNLKMITSGLAYFLIKVKQNQGLHILGGHLLLSVIWEG